MAADGLLRGVRRLLRLWQAHATLDWLLLTRDLKLCLTYQVADLVSVAGSAAAMLLLAERFQGIGSWSRPQVLFLLGYAALVGGFMEMLFNYNVLFISRRLGRGQLDHSLIQPQPIGMVLLTEGFAPFTGSAALLPGAALMAWALRSLPHVVSAAWAAKLALNAVASGGIVLAFSYLWGSLAFRAPRAAEEVSSSAMHLMNQLRFLPLDGLGPGLLVGLTTAVPVGLVAWFPCRVLLGLERGPWEWAVTPAAAVVLLTLAAWAFNRGMSHYVCTGSQRYLSFGHRR